MGSELTNATLLRADPPPVTGPAGDPLPSVPGPPLAVRCIADEPTFGLRRLIDDLELSATTALYVFVDDWPAAASALVPHAGVTVAADGMGGPVTYRVEWVKPRPSDAALAHVTCLLREG